MEFINAFLSTIMEYCYEVVRDYGLAIILFTFISKIVLLPVSIWVQKNSIKMVKMQPEINEVKVKYFGDKDTIAEKQSELYKKYKYNAFASVIPMVIQIVILIALIGVIKEGLQTPGIATNFCGFKLENIPVTAKGIYYLVPLIAGAAAYLLCWVQNRVNVLQANSSMFEKYFTMIVSVGLSLYLGFYVQVGVIIYWIASNLFGILQIFVLNAAINPKKYIDYERLEKSRKSLEELSKLEGKNKISKEDKKREKQDYKRFFSIGNKHLVFYSENSGFYKYFKGIIEYILNNTNIIIHYITSDPNDKIFEVTNDRIKTYYIGQTKLITLMMKMDADIVVMTTPDLNNYQIKRSYVRKDIEYIYVQHHMGSINMILRKGSVDNFDTVFISGPHHEDEIRATEKYYNLKPKKLVNYGFPLLDEMLESYKAKSVDSLNASGGTILIAPSWHSDGIMSTCIEELISNLLNTQYRVIVRPHPQYVRHNREYLETLSNSYADTNIEIQFDFSSNDTVMDADCLLTDWSSIAFEYAFTTGRPVLFVNTPMKVHNPEYQNIDVVPFDVWIRDKIGISIELNDVKNIKREIERLFASLDQYKQDIFELRDNNIYNIGNASETGAKYIISSLQQKIKNRRKDNEK